VVGVMLAAIVSAMRIAVDLIARRAQSKLSMRWRHAEAQAKATRAAV
jgi:hypothetical protein